MVKSRAQVAHMRFQRWGALQETGENRILHGNDLIDKM